MTRAIWIAAALQFSTLSVGLAESPSVPGGRVETRAELETYRNSHEIERLGVFLTEPGEVDLPNLRKAEFINIDSDQVTAVSLPALESVRYLFIRGRRIETLELPQLQYANIDFRVQGTMIRELDLQSLRRAGHLLVTSNPELAAVHVPFVHEFAQVTLANNPALGPEVQQQLQSLQAPTDTSAKPTFMPITLQLRAPSIRATGKTHARFDTARVSPPRRSNRDLYPRFVPFYPMFRPFIGGYWGFR